MSTRRKATLAALLALLLTGGIGTYLLTRDNAENDDAQFARLGNYLKLYDDNYDDGDDYDVYGIHRDAFADDDTDTGDNTILIIIPGTPAPNPTTPTPGGGGGIVAPTGGGDPGDGLTVQAEADKLGNNLLAARANVNDDPTVTLDVDKFGHALVDARLNVNRTDRGLVVTADANKFGHDAVDARVNVQKTQQRSLYLNADVDKVNRNLVDVTAEASKRGPNYRSLGATDGVGSLIVGDQATRIGLNRTNNLYIRSNVVTGVAVDPRSLPRSLNHALPHTHGGFNQIGIGAGAQTGITGALGGLNSPGPGVGGELIDLSGSSNTGAVINNSGGNLIVNAGIAPNINLGPINVE